MTPEVSQFLNILSVWAVPVLLAITLHEAAHGFAAWRLGDETAWRLGRVSLNPLRHVDPVGTVLLPAVLVFSAAPFLFGWAKPIPVVFRNLNRPRRDMVLVAAAGPAANLFLATCSALLFHLLPLLPTDVAIWVGRNLQNSILVNLVLAVFNLLPVPPLDGGRIAVGLLPDALAGPLARLERYGFAVIIGVLLVLPMLGRAIGVDLNISYWLIVVPVRFLSGVLMSVTGLG